MLRYATLLDGMHHSRKCSHLSDIILHLVRDKTFPLKPYLLRHYSSQNITRGEPNKIFNYRLFKARRVVENSFGILSFRWGIFLSYLKVQSDMASTYRSLLLTEYAMWQQ